VPVVGNVDLRLYGLVTRHGLWEEGRKDGFWERWGASKIKVVIQKLGTGQGVMYASQVVKIGCLKIRVVESQVRVIEGTEERSTSQGYPGQRMHSMGMYLGLQSTRILVGFLRVAAASSAKSEHALARGWSHGMHFFVECLERRGYCAYSGLVHGGCWMCV